MSGLGARRQSFLESRSIGVTQVLTSFARPRFYLSLLSLSWITDDDWQGSLAPAGRAKLRVRTGLRAQRQVTRHTYRLITLCKYHPALNKREGSHFLVYIGHGFPGGSVGENLPANAGAARGSGSTPGSEGVLRLLCPLHWQAGSLPLVPPGKPLKGANSVQN